MRKSFSDNYKGIGKQLEEEMGYNLRERINIYAGASMGIVAPIILGRLSIAYTGLKCNTFTDEALAWGASLVANIGCTVLDFKYGCGFKNPLVISTMVGTIIGGLRAESLKNKRVKRENMKGLEDI